MKQTDDFLAESNALAAIVEDMSANDLKRVTQFKDWTIEDVIVHLYFWNLQADRSIFNPAPFAAQIGKIVSDIDANGMRAVENASIRLRGSELVQTWQQHYRDFCGRLQSIDPKMRVKWAGPDMSVRSSITARQMETWAHGHEVFDLLGLQREDDDRIENIVILGVNTFQWSHHVQGLEIPARLPYLRLTAPSAEIWEFGETSSYNHIEGSAVAFAQVVTQTRNVANTDLQVNGPVAERWMATAQCFAGGKATPPSQGTRFIQSIT
ncbi:MAG: TIGR03084 family protein [Gammaproteobacteria bacterium]|nr:TIGR03084 family protein [Gammaproteobacteria bacterium]